MLQQSNRAPVHPTIPLPLSPSMVQPSVCVSGCIQFSLGCPLMEPKIHKSIQHRSPDIALPGPRISGCTNAFPYNTCRTWEVDFRLKDPSGATSGVPSCAGPGSAPGRSEPDSRSSQTVRAVRDLNPLKALVRPLQRESLHVHDRGKQWRCKLQAEVAWFN